MQHVAEILSRMLFDKYKSEFVVIDGLNRHPDNISFEQWLSENYGENGEKLYATTM